MYAVEKYGSRITAMAVINSLAFPYDIPNVTVKTLLHQRAREWAINDRSNDPRQCVKVPPENSTDDDIKDSSAVTTAPTPDTASKIDWMENLSTIPSVTEIIDYLKHLVVTDKSPPPIDNGDCDMSTDDAICPMFPYRDPNGGFAGECVFTSPEIQAAVLDFFEEVAQNPAGFKNPIFKPVPAPAPSSFEDFDDFNQPEINPEQTELEEKKRELAKLVEALEVTPKDKPELKAGIAAMVKRMEQAKEKIRELEQEGLASGGLGQGEAGKARDEWDTTAESGTKIPFAGTMVDSESLRRAGLGKTADDELARLDRHFADDD